ncbi:hypothetical protein BSK59_16340 [Paenibacillus odorifer]|uniref:hypothetical protein n=1 Tax=Paenibacillus odorifer TaxID=189426 RepID=UPI00096F50C2|nr:hypothetical protein [Paenibacillus odorifer]OME54147.1 hypothetical protein BSK59_16340 [Paenibacillus odorifer]
MLNYIDMYKRVWGNKDMKAVTVTADNGGLTISLEQAISFAVTLPAKTYVWDSVPRKSELVDEINSQLKSLNATVECIVGGVQKDVKYDCLVFRSTDSKNIVDVIGTFANEFFL